MPFIKCTHVIFILHLPDALHVVLFHLWLLHFLKYIFKWILKIRRGLFKWSLDPSSACLSVLAITRFVLWLCKWLRNKWAAVTKYQPLPFFSQSFHCIIVYMVSGLSDQMCPKAQWAQIKSLMLYVCGVVLMSKLKNTKSKDYEVGLYHSSIFCWMLTNCILNVG